MAKLDLTQYGITGSKVIAHNPSYEFLFEEETKAGLTGFDKGQNTELNAVNVMTGIYTGRSPKDKYIVKDAQSQDKVWWTSEEYKNDNHPMSEEVWKTVKFGRPLKTSPSRSSATRICMLLTLSAVPTRLPVCAFVSSWRLLGRLTSLRTCSSSPPLRSWRASSLTS